MKNSVEEFTVVLTDSGYLLSQSTYKFHLVQTAPISYHLFSCSRP